MDVKTVITYFPLKLLDGMYHVFKKTQILADSETEDMGCLFEERKDADDMANDLQRKYNEGKERC